MKINRSNRTFKFALLLGACALLASQTVNAQLLYHVTVQTSALNLPAVSGNAPFSVDLQLNYGGGLAETATVSNVSFTGGGSADESSVFLSGPGVTGSLASSVTFTANSTTAFNDFGEDITPGSTLSFDLLLSNNASAGSPSGFIFSILDQAFNPITTTDTLGSLATFQIDGEEVAPANRIEVFTYAGTGDYSGVTISVQQVPEPSAWALLIVGGAAILGFRLRARKA